MYINKYVFYLLSFTWGLPLTILGCIAALILILLGYKPKKWLYGYYFEIGKNWGGVEAGIFFFCQKNSGVDTKNHEFGHAIQNCYFGPLFLPLIGIPSAIRYWYREYLVQIKKYKYSDLPDYDSVWFEGSATKIGYKYFNKIR